MHCGGYCKVTAFNLQFVNPSFFVKTGCQSGLCSGMYLTENVKLGGAVTATMNKRPPPYSVKRSDEPLQNT